MANIARNMSKGFCEFGRRVFTTLGLHQSGYWKETEFRTVNEYVFLAQFAVGRHSHVKARTMPSGQQMPGPF